MNTFNKRPCQSYEITTHETVDGMIEIGLSDTGTGDGEIVCYATREGAAPIIDALVSLGFHKGEVDYSAYVAHSIGHTEHLTFCL